MAKSTPPSSTVFFLILLLTFAPTPSHSFSDFQYRTVVSLAQSLMTRVANLRASRGDLSGSHRAQLIGKQLEHGLGLGLWSFMWSVGSEYVDNYESRDILYSEMQGAVSDMNELLRCLGELTQTNSEAQRAAWMGGNYQNVLNISKSLFTRLLKVLHQSETLREVVETVEKEVVEGGLLRDCLELGSNDLNGLIQISNELGSNDLNGLIQISKDLGLQFYSTSHNWLDL